MEARMSYRTICLATLSAIVCLAQARADDLQRLSEDGITVSYPAGMQVQAKRVLEIARQSFEPSIRVHRETVSLLSDVSAVSKSITDLLGADEKTDEVATRLQAFKDKSSALVKGFSNILLVKKIDAVRDTGVDGGILKVAYTEQGDDFKMALWSEFDNAEVVERSFFPVIVNSDGSIRSEKDLGKIAEQFLGSGDPIAIAPIQETVGYIIAQQLKIYHPLSRWFNEGVSAWVMRRIVLQADPTLSALTDNMFSVSDRSEQLRGKVNLLAWPQFPFQNRNSPDYDPALEAAHTQYAIQLVSELLGDNGATLLPKLMNEISYTGNADTDSICKAVQKVTGQDLKAVLMSYVPEDVARGIKTGEAKQLASRAEAQIQNKQWDEAANTMLRALRMTPDDANLRLNLACAQREIRQNVESEFQVFLLAALLQQGKQPFHLFQNTLEGRYVLARLAILVGNLESAKAFLQPLIEQNPDHKDAKRAMEEIHKLEETAKGDK
ncbi:MAG: hypothetical protein A2Z18_07910 [Armatimonadetes bacterium RBG_16_58_9]|nr:MAG: hypothetical protein A2Z18_07910 [Armatimonadetes bacterium RBG_16_58_9]